MGPFGHRWRWLPLLIVAVVVTGCAMPASLGTSGSGADRAVTLAEGAEQLRSFEFTGLPVLVGQPLWRRSYEGSVGAALSPDGQHAAIYGYLPELDGKLGFVILNREGQEAWRHTYPAQQLAATTVRLFGQPMTVTAVAHDAAQTGFAYAFDAQGVRLWERAIDGSSSLVASDDGERFLLINHVKGTLELLDRNSRVLTSLTVTPNVRAQFINDENAVLVHDVDVVRLLAASGAEIWSHKVGRELTWSVALSSDAQSIAVITAGNDSTAYVFDSKGKLRWSRQLLLGGSNRPLFAADGQTLYVYDVGGDAGIYALTTATGALRWRLLLKPPAGTTARIRDFRAGAEGLVFDYVLAASTAGEAAVTTGDGQEHWLVMADPGAKDVRRLALGRGAALDASLDGRYALVTKRVRGAQDSTRTDVLLYDLATLRPMPAGDGASAQDFPPPR